MKPSEKEQGVIVLGSGIGGLLAGTILAKKKLPILLLREKGYQPFYLTQGYQFAPFSNLSEKRLGTQLIKTISQALTLPRLMETGKRGRNAAEAFNATKQRSTFQVILPKARIDIFPQRHLIQKEWKREFSRETVQIEKIYNELERLQHLLQKGREKKNRSPFFPFRPRSLAHKCLPFDPFPREPINKRLHVGSKEFKEFVQLQLISWGNLYSNQFPLFLVAHMMIGKINDWNPDIDLERIEKEMFGQFLKSGGRVEEIGRVEKISGGWRKGWSLSLERDSRMFRSKFLILSSPLHRATSLLGLKGRKYSKWGKKIKPLYVILPLFLGIRENAVPVGMGDLVISILDLDKSYEDGNVLLLSLSPRGDETKAPEGRRALTVECLIDFSKWEQTFLMDYQQGVMKHLYHLFPFLEQDIELIDFQWANDQVPRWSYPRFLYKASSDFDWRGGVIPMRLSRDLYLVGTENFPHLGLEGEILGGFRVAQQILKKSSPGLFH